MRAVLFDLGNVLVRLDYARAAARYASLRGGESVDLAALYGLPEVEAIARGTITHPQLYAALGSALAVSLDEDAWRDVWCDLFSPFPEMEALAEEVIAAGHPTFLASNTDRAHFEHVAPRLPVLTRMRGLHLSYEVGALKPEPAFFTRLVTRFGLEAKDCVFLDDRGDNVAAARALGIEAEVFTGDPAAARAFLRRAGVRIL